MRKISIYLLLSGMSIICFAGRNPSPKWIDLGVKISYSPNILFNLNQFNDNIYSPKYSAGYVFGGKLGFNFNDEHQIIVEGLHAMRNYEIDLKSELISGTQLFKHTSLDIPLLYRKNDSNGGYFEIGPQLSLYNNPEIEFDGTTLGGDYSDELVKNNYAAVMGFGQYVGLGDKLGFMFGFRFGYNLTDIISKDYQTDAGSFLYTPITEEAVESFEYEATNPMFAMVTLEFNFDLGYMVSSKCGKSTKFMLF